MKLLLDTHTFIWLVTDPDKIPATAQAAVADSANTKYFNVVSAWEMAIKSGIGKMKFGRPVPQLIRKGLADLVALDLQVTLEHAFAVEALPPHHNDPFDRLLIAQAQIEAMTIVTVDHLMPAYGVPILW